MAAPEHPLADPGIQLPLDWLAVTNDRASTADLLNTLEQHRDRLEAEGLVLLQRWVAAFPRGALAFRLVRLAGESNTLLRWRSRGGTQQVRGGRFELIDARDQFAALPSPVRARVLEFEQTRIVINHDFAVASYRVQRLQTLIAQRGALAELRRLHRQVGSEVIPAQSS